MSRGVLRAAVTIVAAVLASGSCSFSPLAHKIGVGTESFVLFVGDGADHNTDLFAIETEGGAVAQVTFTPLIEASPRLSPHGEVVAFIRMHDTLPDAERSVVLMNLLNGGEMPVRLPDGAGIPRALAWADDASALWIRTDRATWKSTVPPAKIVVERAIGVDSVMADSALAPWVGRPRFARIIPCHGGLCVLGPQGDTTDLARDGHDPIRWGDDSVAWFQGKSIVIRSLGPGHPRTISWNDGPTNPRDGSYATARAVRDSQ